MAMFDNQLISRAIQKRDKNRVALRKSACGAVMIDGLEFSVSVESDGAASNKGVVFTLTGDAVENGNVKINMLEVTYPSAAGVRTIKRKPELYKKKDGKHNYRCELPEVRIADCADPESLGYSPTTEDALRSSTKDQIIFRFTPSCKKLKGEEELMLNIYPAANPLDGSCTEWIIATADKEFFEHGGLAKIMKSKRKK